MKARSNGPKMSVSVTSTSIQCSPKGMTIRDVLKSAFDPGYLKMEERMNEICDMHG